MSPSRRRLFVLLGAYEDLAERESSALRRGDIEYVLSIQERKARLTETMHAVRRAAELSREDILIFDDRVRSLTARESGNLDALRTMMAQVRQSLTEIGQAMQRSRKVRRGYSAVGASVRTGTPSVLGQA